MNLAYTSLVYSHDFYRMKETRYGAVLYDVNEGVGQAFQEYGEYEELKLQTILQHTYPGDYIVDIGSHLGYVTLPLSYKVGNSGKVISFEFRSHLFQLLSANLALNNINNVNAYQKILSDQNSFLFEQDNLTPSLQSLLDTKKVSYPVDVLRLDSLELPYCHLININYPCEKSIIDVLKGSTRTLQQFKPTLFIEVFIKSDEIIKELRRWLSHLGYRVKLVNYSCYNRSNFYNSPYNIFRLETKSYYLAEYHQ